MKKRLKIICGILLNLCYSITPLMSATTPSTPEKMTQVMPKSLPSFPFYMIRHGETDWNIQGKIQGQTDIPLNKTGREQAHKAALSLKNRGIQKIYSSNLKRARETAEIIHDVLELKEPIQINNDLAERSMGQLEGHYYKNLSTLNLDISAQGIVGSESQETFYNRAIHAIGECVHENGVLIVTHGGVVGAFMEAIHSKNRNIDNAIPFYITPPTNKWSPWSVIKTTPFLNPSITD